MKFQFGQLVPLPDDATFTAMLGATTGAGAFTDKDKHKAVKLGGDSRYILCADGNDIEGQVISIEPDTSDGYGKGTVCNKDRIYAINAGAGAIAVGAFVVAAAQPAVGTELPRVSTGLETGVRAMPVKAGAGVFFLWRVISLLNDTGAVGKLILIERVS